MKMAIVELESVAAYSQSRHYDEQEVPKKDKELPNDYEKRTWMHRCHTDENGRVFIPPMAFKNCLADAAKYLSLKVPGQRNATWTKNFLAGILVTEGITLPIQLADVEHEWLFVPSDGQRGGGRRVNKCFPLIRKWAGRVTYYILDDKITRDVFEQVLREAGNIIGIGRFRPQNGGFYGRFKVKSLEWKAE